MSNILEVNNLSLSIATGHVIQGKKQILDQISFSVPEGKATAYLGVNGAGKTSTFRVLCGLCRADQGEISFKGQRLNRGLPSHAIGFMPEQPYFYRNLSPYELLSGMARISGISQSQIDTRIHEWAEKLHFSKVLRQPLSSCSKGQTQRVGIAQALLHDPSFILLDEPLSGLDPLGRDLVRTVLMESVSNGATLLFSSHILSDAEAICDHVVVLNQGKIAFQGAMSELLNSERKWVITIQGKPMTTSSLSSSPGLDHHYQMIADDLKSRDELIRAVLNSADQKLISVEQQRQTLEHAFLNLLCGEDHHD